MNSITTKATVKVAIVATGLAMATSLFSLAPMAHAQTACSVGTTNLTVGSSGAAVTCLQQGLIAKGYSIPAGATGYFGSQTKAAVAAWQAAAGVAPAAGYFGSISRAAWGGSTSTGGTSSVPGCMPGYAFSPTTGQACTVASTVPGCTAGAMYSATTGQLCTTSTSVPGLTGAGRLTNISSLGDVYSDLDEGDSSTAVVGISADATGGDVALQRVDVEFTISSNVSGSSANLNKYVSDVSLYLGSTKLASMDPAMGDKDGRVWTMRFSGLNGVIAKGTTGNLYVKVTPVSSIGANEDGETITVDLDANSVRAVSADGISDTYVLDATISGQTFTVSSMTAGTLTVTTAGDNPKASQVAVSSSTTTGVKLLSFNMKAKNSDVTITDLVAVLNTPGVNVNNVVNTVYLMRGSTVLKSKTASTGVSNTITFNDVNRTIAKDDTENFSIVVDLKGNAAYADGTTLLASTTVSGWDVSDTNGASVTPSAVSQGNTMTLTSTGISVAKGSFTAVKTTCALASCGDNGLYTMPFTVTAGDSDVYIGAAVTRAATPSASAGGVNYATTTTSTSTLSPSLATSFAAADSVSGDVAGTAFKVSAGTSRTFTLTVSATAAATGLFAFQITGINYGPTSTLGTTYYTSNLDTFKTDALSLVKN